MRILIAAVSLALLAGCSTYGKPVTQAQLDDIKQGTTTKEDLIGSFGPPLMVTKNSDGTQIMSWGYAKVGFAGSSYKNQGLSVVLDASGKVSSFTTTETGSPYQ